jgi:hypothetical protein
MLLISQASLEEIEKSFVNYVESARADASLLDELKELNSAQETKLIDAKQRIVRLETALANSKQHNSQLEQSLLTHKQQNAELEQSLAEYKQQNTQLEQTLADCKQHNGQLEANIIKCKQHMALLEREHRSTQKKMVRSLEIFKDNASTISYPVMQNNGLIVDFYRIIPKWARAAEEEESTAFRVFNCAITGKSTSLAHLLMTERIQQIAMNLGLKVDPPLVFEQRVNDVWTKLSAKLHIQLTAVVCYMYARREEAVTGDFTMKTTQATFRLSKVFSCIHSILPTHTEMCLRQGDRTLYTLSCHQSGIPVRIRINREGWNPFRHMVFATDSDHQRPSATEAPASV